jgi:hypothetical protein
MVETFAPGAAAFGGPAATSGAGFSSHHDNSSRGRGRGRGRGGATGPPAGVQAAAGVSGRGGGGRGGRGGGGRGGASLFGPPAQLQGVEVCFRFNSVTGCQRTKVTNRTCQEGMRVFVHACDWLDPATNKHCLKDHARHMGGH